jgi:hypothetical protein
MTSMIKPLLYVEGRVTSTPSFQGAHAKVSFQQYSHIFVEEGRDAEFNPTFLDDLRKDFQMKEKLFIARDMAISKGDRVRVYATPKEICRPLEDPDGEVTFPARIEVLNGDRDTLREYSL